MPATDEERDRLVRVEAQLDLHMQTSEQRSARMEGKLDTIGTKVDQLVGAINSKPPEPPKGGEITVAQAIQWGRGLAKVLVPLAGLVGIGGAFHECSAGEQHEAAVQAPTAPEASANP